MNKKILFLRILFTALLLGTFWIIFSFSQQNGEVSTDTSTTFLYKIVDFLNGSKAVNEEVINKFDPLFRKIAHFSIYTTVGFWAMGLMCTFFDKMDENKKEIVRITISTSIGFLYSISDEIHQLYSNGRSGSILDVIIDTLGVANGVLIVLIIIKVYLINKTDK